MSVRTSSLFKIWQNKTVGLAEWIIDDTHMSTYMDLKLSPSELTVLSLLSALRIHFTLCAYIHLFVGLLTEPASKTRIINSQESLVEFKKNILLPSILRNMEKLKNDFEIAGETYYTYMVWYSGDSFVFSTRCFKYRAVLVVNKRNVTRKYPQL